MRYIAENMSAFDYKTQEEILTVIRHLTHVLSVAGMHVVEILHQERRAQETSESVGPNEVCAQSSANGMSYSRLWKLMPLRWLRLMDWRELGWSRLYLSLSSLKLISNICMGLLKSESPRHPPPQQTLTAALIYRKASRWVPGKKTAAGDKPAVVRHDKPISWERVTFATRVGHTGEDVKTQEEQLLELWAEDGVTAEPDDFGD